MTNTRMEEIAAHARMAYMASLRGAPVNIPSSYTAEEAKLWEERFKRALRGVHE